MKRNLLLLGTLLTETTFRLNLAKLYIKAGKSALAKPELLYLQGLGEKFAGQAEVTQLLRSL